MLSAESALMSCDVCCGYIIIHFSYSVDSRVWTQYYVSQIQTPNRYSGFQADHLVESFISVICD